MQTTKNFYGKGKNHIYWLLIMVKSFLCLNYQCDNHLVRWNNTWNQISLSAINNDNINQSVSAINK